MTYTCQICMEEMMKETHTTPCNHVFHEQCIDKWRLKCVLQSIPKISYEKERDSVVATCPVCRSGIPFLMTTEDYDTRKKVLDEMFLSHLGKETFDHIKNLMSEILK